MTYDEDVIRPLGEDEHSWGRAGKQEGRAPLQAILPENDGKRLKRVNRIRQDFSQGDFLSSSPGSPIELLLKLGRNLSPLLPSGDNRIYLTNSCEDSVK